MFQKNLPNASPVGRRIRLSRREIVASVILTVAALVAIVAVQFGATKDEAKNAQPVASDVRRSK